MFNMPDLPQYMNIDGNAIYHFLKKLDILKQKKLYKYVDGMVYFSKHMNDFFSFQEGKWIVIEGLVDSKAFSDQKSQEKEGRKILLYSGAVEVAYGIRDLLQAFELIEGSDYQLQIIGGGSGVAEVLEACKKDARIQYLGVLERNTVLEYQKKATVLINPRRAKDAFTKYSFPSKTLEYMMSGTPIIMHKLEGIPCEYDNYITYFSNCNINDMAIQMKKLCDEKKECLEKRGNLARKFVLEEKNNLKQMLKLYNFLNTL